MQLPIAGFSTLCIYFFFLGSYMSLKSKDMWADCSKLKSTILGLMIALTLVMATISYFTELKMHTFFHNLYLLTTVLCIFGFIGQYVRKGTMNFPSWVAASSFFIFACHKPLQVIVRRLCFALFKPENECILTGMIFIVPMVVVCISLSIFYIIRRYMPSLKFLNGFRL